MPTPTVALGGKGQKERLYEDLKAYLLPADERERVRWVVVGGGLGPLADDL